MLHAAHPPLRGVGRGSHTNDAPAHTLRGELCGTTTRTATRGAERFCRYGCVASGRTISPQFTAYGGWRAAEYPGHGPDTRTLQMQACNGQALFGLKLLILSSFVHRNTLYETGVALHI
jgi:hypothetical protein